MCIIHCGSQHWTDEIKADIKKKKIISLPGNEVMLKFKN